MISHTRLAFCLVLSALLASAAPATAGAQVVLPALRLIAPAAPGGGWDQTARAMQQVLQQAGLVQTASVENIPGAAGTIGLARFISAERGRGDVVLVSGLIMLSGIVTNASPVTLREVTPVARLTGEYEVIVVPSASPFRSLQDLLRTFQQRPESISWGGGSAGGSDQILTGLVADAVGVSPRRVNYIAFSGGGEAMSAILGGQVSVGINGLAEFLPQIEAGTVRVLGLSSAERLPNLDAPTLREQGIDIAFENWRSLVAAPGISPDDLARLERTVDAMVRSAQWRDALNRYRWIDRYLARADFARFLDTEDTRVRSILSKLGLGSGNAPARATAHVYPLFVLAGLIFFGCAALLAAWRGSRLRSHRGILRAASGLADAPTDAAARRRTTPPDNETAARPSEPDAGPRWRSAALLTAGVILDLTLMERAGFVITSAALFWLTARAFDQRHPVRDGVFAVVVATSSYLLFVRVLNVTLPAGLLARWL